MAGDDKKEANELYKFTPKETFGIVVFVASMLLQYYGFRSEVREGFASQKGRDDIQDLRIKTVEEKEGFTAARYESFRDQQEIINSRLDIMELYGVKPKTIHTPAPDDDQPK